MPLFACGRGYSRKLPIATVAVMVVCVVIVCVPVGVVEDGVALVLLQATKSRVRSIKEHNKDGRFMIIIPYSSTATYAYVWRLPTQVTHFPYSTVHHTLIPLKPPPS